jgi:hypothetical protein
VPHPLPSLPAWLVLEPGEQILFHERPDRLGRLGSYMATLCLFELWRRRTHFVLTDRRLITFRGVVSRDQQVIPLQKIESLTISTRGPSATLNVATAGGALGRQPFGPLGRTQAQRLADAVERARRTGVA